jgi:hypothetical protein
VDEQARLVKPLHSFGDALFSGVGGQRFLFAVHGGHVLGPVPEAVGLAGHLGQDITPHLLPGFVGPVAAGGEVGQLGGGHQQAVLFKEQRVLLHVVDAVLGPVEAHHLGQHDQRVPGLHGQHVAVVNTQ